MNVSNVLVKPLNIESNNTNSTYKSQSKMYKDEMGRISNIEHHDSSSSGECWSFKFIVERLKVKVKCLHVSDVSRQFILLGFGYD